jgi:hypothetical protein
MVVPFRDLAVWGEEEHLGRLGRRRGSILALRERGRPGEGEEERSAGRRGARRYNRDGGTMSETKSVPVKVTIDEATADGHYVNFANILHNPTEFVLDFGRAVPGKPDVKVMSRILTTPYHAKQLARALQQNIEIYERNYGEIRSDFPNPLAEVTDTPTN